MNTTSKCFTTTKFLAEALCLLMLLPAVGFFLMTKPRRETQAMGSALFVIGSTLWLLIIIAVSCGA